MNEAQSAVVEFHEKFGAPIGESPAIRRPELRASLIIEEARETAEAIIRGDLVEAIDGLCDLLYVTYGAALEFGVDLDPFYREVHVSNMRKEGGGTRPDGKILKPEGWEPPRIAGLLASGAGAIAYKVSRLSRAMNLLREWRDKHGGKEHVMCHNMNSASPSDLLRNTTRFLEGK